MTCSPAQVPYLYPPFQRSPASGARQCFSVWKRPVSGEERARKLHKRSPERCVVHHPRAAKPRPSTVR
ncbi:hypothetical protein AAFF_G00025800 [Aldrovandia affinis]|uniref:Uncharacterized protein n=1 Tax=Aldrovandia affinis TaxID=143900 RepID=A0AAD7S566_9TELE|nr:hypothetical protein AAFF_G00025800 [Aldrovandia affinis]